MYQFDEDIMSHENVKRLIKIYQSLIAKFPTVKWGETKIVINPIVAEEFGIVDGQSIDTVCFARIMTYMKEHLLMQQFDNVQPSDFEETIGDGDPLE
jgi:hypothetical protein